MENMTRIRALVIGGLAWSGVILGHLVAYVVAYPAEVDRSTRLAETGHGSFPLLLVSAVAAIPAVLSLLAVRVIRGERSPTVLTTALWLGAIQVPVFVAMEFFERGMSFELLLLEPALIVGLVIQVLVAVTSAILLTTVFRALRAFISRRSDVPKLATARPIAPTTDEPPARFDFLSNGLRRAPPLTRAS
jgi:hypothetical protein